MRIAILITCHNRKACTLRCLERVYLLRVPEGVALDVFLVDDGSSDGTTEAVNNHFPSVHTIKGDGSLYWCGGMRTAWAEAAKHDFDAYLWLNDDTFLYENALDVLYESLLLQKHKTDRQGIVFGSSRDPGSGEASFGVFSFRGVEAPPASAGPASTFNGNVVWVSREAFATLGSLSTAYRHSFGDIDYGLRAQRAGIPVWAAPGFLAECRPNGTPEWRNPSVSLRRRWRALHDPKGCPPVELAHFARLSAGWRWPLVLLKLYCRVIWPRLSS